MKKGMKIAEILIIFCILSAPVLLLSVMPKQVYPINENRVMKEFPVNWKAMFTENGEYWKELSACFNDRFQFRDFMIRAKGEIQYRLFNVTGEDGVYVGDDGYMYYKSVVDRDQIINEQLSDEDVNGIVQAYEDFKAYINAFGVECLFMIPPQKNTVFPERAPVFHVERKYPNQYEKLIQKFSASRVSDDFVDVVPLLRKAEEKYPTYYKTDFHWNEYGVTAAFTEAVNRLAKREQIENQIFDENMYDIYYDPYPWGERGGGGQLDNLPLLEKIQEDCALCVNKKTDITVYVDVEQSVEGQTMHYVNTNAQAPLGTVLFVGDSYTQFLLNSNSGILDLFKEVWFVHVNYADGVVNRYIQQVDYMIVERIESNMASLRELLNSSLRDS